MSDVVVQIMEEVRHAPRRRLDNIITRLYDSARLLAMHATVLEAVRKEYKSAQVGCPSAAGVVTYCTHLYSSCVYSLLC